MSDRNQGTGRDPDDRDWFNALDLRRIAGLIAMIAVAFVLFSLIFDVPLLEGWSFTVLIFANLIGAFFVSGWAGHYAGRQIEGALAQRVFSTSVLIAYALTMFFVIKAILNI